MQIVSLNMAYFRTRGFEFSLPNSSPAASFAIFADENQDCWIGGHAVVLPGVTLGRGVVIGAGSVVTRVWFLFPKDVISRANISVLGYSGFSCCCWESSTDFAKD